MFRATNSPILRSSFDCIYSFWYNALIMLPTGATVEMERVCMRVCVCAYVYTHTRARLSEIYLDLSP